MTFKKSNRPLKLFERFVYYVIYLLYTFVQNAFLNCLLENKLLPVACRAKDIHRNGVLCINTTLGFPAKTYHNYLVTYLSSYHKKMIKAQQ